MWTWEGSEQRIGPGADPALAIDRSGPAFWLAYVNAGKVELIRYDGTSERRATLGPGADPQIVLVGNIAAVAAQRKKDAGIDVWWVTPDLAINSRQFVAVRPGQSPVNGIRKPRLCADPVLGGVWLAWEDRATYLVHLLPREHSPEPSDHFEVDDPADTGGIAVAPTGELAVCYRGGKGGGKIASRIRIRSAAQWGEPVKLEHESSDFTSTLWHPKGCFIVFGPTRGGLGGLYAYAVKPDGSILVNGFRFAAAQLVGLDDADHVHSVGCVLDDQRVAVAFNGSGPTLNGKQAHLAYVAVINGSAVEILRCSDIDSNQGAKYRGVAIATNGSKLYAVWGDQRPGGGIYYRVAVDG